MFDWRHQSVSPRIFPSCVALLLVAAWKTAVRWVCEECQNTRFTKIAASLDAFQTTPRPQRKSRRSLFICGTNKPLRLRHPTTQMWLHISGSVRSVAPPRTHRGHRQTRRPYYYAVNKYYCRLQGDLKYKPIFPSCHTFRNNRRLQ